MKKVITLTENDLIKLINRVIIEQKQEMSNNILDMPAFSKYKGNPEIRNFIEQFQAADKAGRISLIANKVATLKNKFPKAAEKINSLLNSAKAGADVSCEATKIKNNIEQKMTGEKSSGAMFALVLVIILLVVLVGTGGPRSCAEEMGLM